MKKLLSLSFTGLKRLGERKSVEEALALDFSRLKQNRVHGLRISAFRMLDSHSLWLTNTHSHTQTNTTVFIEITGPTLSMSGTQTTGQLSDPNNTIIAFDIIEKTVILPFKNCSIHWCTWIYSVKRGETYSYHLYHLFAVLDSVVAIDFLKPLSLGICSKSLEPDPKL